MFWDIPVWATDGTPNGAHAVDEILQAASRKRDRTLFVMSAGFRPPLHLGVVRFIDATGHVPQVIAIDPQPSDEAIAGTLTARRVENESVIAQLSANSHRR